MAGFSTVSALLVVVCALMMLPARIEGRFVMPWICADSDPCGNDKGAVDAQIKQLAAGVWLAVPPCTFYCVAHSLSPPPRTMHHHNNNNCRYMYFGCFF
jgi:hypothetical protein